jgi:hypothetical protein
MEHGISPVGPIVRPEGQLIPLRREYSAPADDFLSAPPAPPPELQHELNVAAQVIEELSSKQINLHFEVDDDSNSVRVQVLDGDGKILREIPARSLLDTLSGGGLLIDKHG